MCSEDWEEHFQGVGVGSAQIEPMRTYAKDVAEGFVLSTYYVGIHAYGTREGGIISFICLLSGST